VAELAGLNLDVAEANGLVVTLQLNHTLGSFRFFTAGAGAFGEFDIVVNRHAGLFDRDAGVAGLFSFGECRSREGDVVGLPAEWRGGHVEVGGSELIKAGA